MRISDWSSDVCSSDLLPVYLERRLCHRCQRRWQRRAFHQPQLRTQLRGRGPPEQERQAAQGQDPDRSYPRYRSGRRADLQLRHRVARTAYREAEKAVGMSLRSTQLHRHTVAAQAPQITNVTKPINDACATHPFDRATRSEEPTSELQSLMRNSYAILC